VATITAAGIVAPLAASLSPNHTALLALAIGAGSLFLSHVNDAGFWLVKESFGLTVGQTFKSWSVMETAVSLVGFGFIMALSVLISRFHRLRYSPIVIRPGFNHCLAPTDRFIRVGPAWHLLTALGLRGWGRSTSAKSRNDAAGRRRRGWQYRRCRDRRRSSRRGSPREQPRSGSLGRRSLVVLG
jgi:hypothetical protein